MKLNGAAITHPAAPPWGGGSVPGPTGTAERAPDWLRAVERAAGNGRASGAPRERLVEQLSELLKLQVEVGRYQLRIEMLAKVADSALATLRKLQQTP